MIHARRRKTVRISQNLCAPSRARTNHQNHTRHQASACGSPYGLLGSRPHDQNFKTMVADASRIHTSCFNAPGPSRKRSHKEPPQRRWPASQETSRYASSSSSQCQTIPKSGSWPLQSQQTQSGKGNSCSRRTLFELKLQTRRSLAKAERPSRPMARKA